MTKELRNWKLQKLGETTAPSQVISRSNFDDSQWHNVTVPNSVVGNYVEAGEFEDPYIGTTMKDLPGYKHGRTIHFAFHRMPEDSPFRSSFWYRTTISPDKSSAGEEHWLKFDGLNFRANIWVNGKRVAGSDFVSGTYRQYDLNISHWFNPEKENCIAVELIPQEPDELGMTFIDWSPTPPDDSAGIWQPVTLYSTGTIALKNPAIRSKLNETYDKADLTAEITLKNCQKSPLESTLKLNICGETISKAVSLRSYEEKTVTLTSDEFSQLTIDNPDLWWPWDMGEQHLHSAEFSVIIDDKITDSKTTNFGIREITSQINKHGALHFAVNGKEILIKGTAWSPDLLLRQDFSRDEVDLAYLKQMNFNTVRLEGKLATDNFWEICDREGILVLAGWPCCTHWEQWEKWRPDDYVVAKESLRSQLLRLRNHASFAAWFYGSDFPPIEPVENIYLNELKELTPDLVHVSSAAAFESTLTGKTGVKMSGPYGFVPPSYWYNSDMPGYADSFNTETGPDSSFPRYESVCKMIPDESDRYVGSDSWNHHAGLASFINTDVMNEAIETRYGVKKENLKEFLDASQINSYECWRAMYEAYNRNYPKGTGVIGWMMNGHWPSLIWQMYDYWMFPTGGFYGSRKAGASVHIQYSYDDKSIWVINNSHESFSGSVEIDILDSDSKKVSQEQFTIKVKPQERFELTTPEYPDEELFFINLKLFDMDDHPVHRNFYWLSSTVEIFKAERIKAEWYYRPLIKATDFSKLQTLPETELEISKDITDSTVSITIKNVGTTVAVSLLIDLLDNNSEPLAPILWSDNYLFLTPGEKVVITGDCRFINDTGATVRVTGQNVSDVCL